MQAIKLRAGVSVLLTAGGELGNDRIIETLEAGADDFLPHSLQVELLLAKLRTHLRRIAPPPRAADVNLSSTGALRAGGREARWAQAE